VDPDPKIENLQSPPDREFNIVFHCAQLLRDLATHVKGRGRFPHQWIGEDYTSFNQEYGGERTLTFLPPRGQQANLLRFTRQEFILPSIERMKNDGVVDIDNLRKV
ncbi:hypothetical protein HZB96_01765, partial [Candidatus Gottesmanbacteria bacterium]|nr:hypothetical protein [Candidatus Gottesmanbacteria bacterium]